MADEAKKLFEADKVADAIKTAKEAVDKAADGVAAGEALGCLLTMQLSLGEVSLDDALAKIQAETSKLKKVGGKMGEGAMLLATAEVHLSAGDSDKALKNGLAAQAIFAKEGKALKEAEAIYSVIVGAYIDNSNEEKALSSANQALSLAQQESNKKAESLSWFAVAEARYAGGALDDCMEACTKMLSLFKDTGDKFKEASTHCLMSQIYLVNEDAEAALSSAKDALAVAKDVGSAPQTAAAVELMVEALILKDQAGEALSEAQKELEALKGKTVGVADMMCAVVVATTAAKGANAGFAAVTKFVEECRSAGNQQGEVKMLHRMATLAEYDDVALNTAQAALKLAEKIGDVYQQSKIKSTLTDLWVAKGKLNKAPTRKHALALLNDLARDLADRDADKFLETNKKLNKHWNALTQADMEATLGRVISKDPESAMSFLKEHGVVADEKAKKEGPITGHKFRSVPVANLYMGFRIGGLGYGPRYRVCCSNKTLHAPEAMGIVELQDCSDDWERELGYSPSLLDGCLQTGAAMGH
eukprot:CAMPEP_0204608770 /NCGR_PEP_ID=MMETSP0661-20131031/60512_1 /ASSEMBLY_ACC=CAM_ASM_000606 /TAXON_ID=109239 /ORGANISM="Alexandrium margalefi, Strain AMGDE01CS-322" /LENGTH=530 /DNA_ID=CAMNT_0051620343 /DNA_START=67 /DNA_END=1659 /DNA_ORIENTATION=+